MFFEAEPGGSNLFSRGDRQTQRSIHRQFDVRLSTLLPLPTVVMGFEVQDGEKRIALRMTRGLNEEAFARMAYELPTALCPNFLAHRPGRGPTGNAICGENPQAKGGTNLQFHLWWLKGEGENRHPDMVQQHALAAPAIPGSPGQLLRGARMRRRNHQPVSRISGRVIMRRKHGQTSLE